VCRDKKVVGDILCVFLFSQQKGRLALALAIYLSTSPPFFEFLPTSQAQRLLSHVAKVKHPVTQINPQENSHHSDLI
jgi:hypothetical protein